MSLIRVLRRNPVLSAGDDRALARLAAASSERVLDAGDVLVRVGSPQRDVFLIADGQLELYRRNRLAETQILCGVLHPPSLFGDAELYSKTPWTVSAKAVEPTVVVAMPNAAFDAIVDADGKVAAGLYRDACARQMLVIQIMQIFALQKTQHQILRLLWSVADGDRVAAVSVVQLARALGLNRKTVTRHLKELEALEMLRRDKDSVQLLLPDDLPLWPSLPEHGFGAAWRLPEG